MCMYYLCTCTSLWVQASKAVDIHFFKPSKKRSAKEAQINIHLAEKQRRISLLEPKPKLQPDYVHKQIHKASPKAAVFSVLPEYMQSCQSVAELSSVATDPSLPFSLAELYDPNNSVLSTTDMEQACALALKEITVRQNQADFWRGQQSVNLNALHGMNT